MSLLPYYVSSRVLLGRYYRFFTGIATEGDDLATAASEPPDSYTEAEWEDILAV